MAAMGRVAGDVARAEVAETLFCTDADRRIGLAQPVEALAAGAAVTAA